MNSAVDGFLAASVIVTLRKLGCSILAQAGNDGAERSPGEDPWQHFNSWPNNHAVSGPKMAALPFYFRSRFQYTYTGPST